MKSQSILSALKFRKETHNKTNKLKKVLMSPEWKISKRKKSDGNILSKIEVPIIVLYNLLFFFNNILIFCCDTRSTI